MTTHHSIPKLKLKLRANSISNYALHFYSIEVTNMRYCPYHMDNSLRILEESFSTYYIFHIQHRLLMKLISNVDIGSAKYLSQTYISGQNQGPIDLVRVSYRRLPQIPELVHILMIFFVEFQLRLVFSHFFHDYKNDILSLVLENCNRQ